MFKIPKTDLPAPVDIIDPAELIPLAQLAAEGFGYDNPALVRTPRDAVDVLAAQFGDEVTVDDIGRRCVTRDVARRLLAERAAAEQRQREVMERNAANSQPLPVHGGIPTSEIPEGMTPAEYWMSIDPDRDKGRRRSVLEDALANDGPAYHPIRREGES
jgi:antitoxin component of MazEF toxin-antitoxin module